MHEMRVRAPAVPEAESGTPPHAGSRAAALAASAGTRPDYPAARIAAAIELLAASTQHRRPADAVANDFFRARRFIGSGDRRAVSERVWRVLRARRRRLGLVAGRGRADAAPAGGRLACCWRAGRLPAVARRFPAGSLRLAPFAPSEQAALHRLEGRTLEHPAMPDAVRLEVPGLAVAALAIACGARNWRRCCEPASLDLRVNLLKARARRPAPRWRRRGWRREPTPLRPGGCAWRGGAR